MAEAGELLLIKQQQFEAYGMAAMATLRLGGTDNPSSGFNSMPASP